MGLLEQVLKRIKYDSDAAPMHIIVDILFVITLIAGLLMLMALLGMYALNYVLSLFKIGIIITYWESFWLMIAMLIIRFVFW